MDQKCCSSPGHCVCIPVNRKEGSGRIRVYSLLLRMSTALAHTTFYTSLTSAWLTTREDGQCSFWPHTQFEKGLERGSSSSKCRQEGLLAASATGEKCKNNIVLLRWGQTICRAQMALLPHQADGPEDSWVSQSPNPHTFGCTCCPHFHLPLQTWLDL